MVKQPVIFQNTKVKTFRSNAYNYTFDYRSGYFRRWGRKPEHNPVWSPFGPEIIDIEISAGSGCPMRCSYCYKGNVPSGNPPKNMSFETFRTIFNKLPHITTINSKIFFPISIAFGITSVNTNPHMFDMFDYCRRYGVVPNLTINGADQINDNTLRRLTQTCGAISVSINKTNFDKGYLLIKRMADLDGSKINIHYVLSKQSKDFAYDLCDSVADDFRLKRVNSIVFLGLKPKNRGAEYDVLPLEDFIDITSFCLFRNIHFGFDSCSAPRFEASIEENAISDDQKKTLLACTERCEAGLFSAYIDVNGKYWHCSFDENNENDKGIDVLAVNDFRKDIWLSEYIKSWRKKLIEFGRECPLFPVINVKHT